jgi:hypothetical protein
MESLNVLVLLILHVDFAQIQLTNCMKNGVKKTIRNQIIANQHFFLKGEVNNMANKIQNKEVFKMKEEIEVTLANGYTVELFKQEGNVVLGLINSNGYCVSDKKLTDAEIKTLKDIVNNF